MLMPRFQILHFPSPEMARFFKKCKRKLRIFQKLKFEKIDNNSLTSFFSKLPFLSYKSDEKILSNQNRKKLGFVFKESKFYFAFFEKNWPFLHLEIQKFGI